MKAGGKTLLSDQIKMQNWKKGKTEEKLEKA